MVYSTDPDFEFETGDQEQAESLPPQQQKLVVSLDKKNRKGKKVSLVSGFVGSDEDLKQLARELKSSCGVGGSVVGGEILIQGDFRDRLVELLSKKSYKVKRSGG